jgi:hypothetical protein
LGSGEDVVGYTLFGRSACRNTEAMRLLHAHGEDPTVVDPRERHQPLVHRQNNDPEIDGSRASWTVGRMSIDDSPKRNRRRSSSSISTRPMGVCTLPDRVGVRNLDLVERVRGVRSNYFLTEWKDSVYG